MIFYDFEVFKYDWLVVSVDMATQEESVIHNDTHQLYKLYNDHFDDIWCGYNNKHYDQYILRAILLGMNPKQISDKIIIKHMEGWQISKELAKTQMINYDVMPSDMKSLKVLEGFRGHNIKETSVPFDIDRRLTPEELEDVIKYCRNDVHETINTFMDQIDQFNAMFGIIKAFPQMVSMRDIGDSEARLTAKVLGCQKTDYNDEFDFYVLPCIDVKKYHAVVEWFESCAKEAAALNLNQADDATKRAWYKEKSFTIDVAGVPHTFGFGGMHGAPNDPIHRKGALYHVDVNNYYPSFLIAHGMVTRSAMNDNYPKVYITRKNLKDMQLKAKTKDESKHYKKAQLPYKKMLNALSGAMKDKNNPAYDPRNNNIMCINGQLMLLDLIEHLEVIPEFELEQSNTDGLIVMIPDTDEAFEMLDDICYSWECRMSTKLCDIRLETDQISEIYQKDVNNYLWIDLDGEIERKGAYVKELNTLDYDLPILNKALVDYMTKHVPVEDTINNCDELIMFQKLVKLSNRYEYVEHNGIKYDYKCYRVFASRDAKDGKILKCRSGNNPAKFGNTPDMCFIENGDITCVKVPEKLDKQWYIDLAKKRLNDFGL